MIYFGPRRTWCVCQFVCECVRVCMCVCLLKSNLMRLPLPSRWVDELRSRQVGNIVAWLLSGGREGGVQGQERKGRRRGEAQTRQASRTKDVARRCCCCCCSSMLLTYFQPIKRQWSQRASANWTAREREGTEGRGVCTEAANAVPTVIIFIGWTMPSGSNAMTAMPLAPHLPLVLIGSGAQKCQMTMAKTKDNAETRPPWQGAGEGRGSGEGEALQVLWWRPLDASLINVWPLISTSNAAGAMRIRTIPKHFGTTQSAPRGNCNKKRLPEQQGRGQGGRKTKERERDPKPD